MPIQFLLIIKYVSQFEYLFIIIAQYFSNSVLGGRVLIADYCPFQVVSSTCNYLAYKITSLIEYRKLTLVVERTHTVQMSPINQVYYTNNQSHHVFLANNGLGETFGSGSACFNQPNRNWSFMNESARIRGAGCYLVS